MRLSDKVAIITVATSGIGEAVARSFLEEGAKLVVDDESELRRRSEDAGERVHVFERIGAKTVERSGGIDIPFSHAALIDMHPILGKSRDIHGHVFAINDIMARELSVEKRQADELTALAARGAPSIVKRHDKHARVGRKTKEGSER
ncbi:hypothetical protein YK56LOC_66150 [Caballeronia sp. HLA56]